jgi:hypothetical protein
MSFYKGTIKLETLEFSTMENCGNFFLEGEALKLFHAQIQFLGSNIRAYFPNAFKQLLYKITDHDTILLSGCFSKAKQDKRNCCILGHIIRNYDNFSLSAAYTKK